MNFAAIRGIGLTKAVSIRRKSSLPTSAPRAWRAISVSSYFIAQIIYLQTSPTAFANIGWKFYIVFIVAVILFIIPTFFYFPETKDIPLEEIGKLFNDEANGIDLHAVLIQDTADQKEAVAAQEFS
jgi:hypothetical protein